MADRSMSPLYRLTGVEQRYGRRTVLRVEDLLIGEGEAVALIGPSGAGKSTLLRLLCLLERPSAGAIHFGDRLVNGAIPIAMQREVTMVFQRPMLLDTSVRRNVALGLRLRGEQDDRRVADAIELLGLQAVADARATTLSGGELQRVALARALVIRPRVLLLDEPTANLDPRNVGIMERAIDALRRESRTTLIAATHNLHQARRLTERTLVLLDGVVIEDGPTGAVLDRPQDPRAAAFVDGAMIF